MSDTGTESEILDNEFSQLVKKLETSRLMYDYREKYLVTEWLTKLKNCKSSLDERKLRNHFMKHFDSNRKKEGNVFSSEPFNKIPKDFSGPLKNLIKLLPKNPDDTTLSNVNEKRSYITNLFDKLYDKGTFLAQQSVPRNGTFFILIIAVDEIHNCAKL